MLEDFNDLLYSGRVQQLFAILLISVFINLKATLISNIGRVLRIVRHALRNLVLVSMYLVSCPPIGCFKSKCMVLSLEYSTKYFAISSGGMNLYWSFSCLSRERCLARKVQDAGRRRRLRRFRRSQLKKLRQDSPVDECVFYQSCALTKGYGLLS